MYFKTVPKSVLWLAALSLLFLFLKILVFNRIQEPVVGIHALGVVFEGVLGSVIAGCAFYLIIVHLKEVRDKRAIDPHIAKWAQGVVGDCKAQLKSFENATGTRLVLEQLTLDQVEDVFRRLQPYGKAPLLFHPLNYANWLQFLDHYRDRSQRTIVNIMAQLLYLDAPLVAILTAIGHSPHFSQAELLAHATVRNEDLAPWAKLFFEYATACQELDNYVKQHFKHIGGPEKAPGT